MKRIIISASIILLGLVSFYFYYESRESKKITSEECMAKGGSVVNTLNHLVDGEELKKAPGSYVQEVDPKILKNSIGEVSDVECPCICVVE